MTETSREGFVPRHLRDGRFQCRWHLLDLRPAWDRDGECPNYPDARTGVGLCRDHLRRVGALSGMITRKNAREWAEADNEAIVRQYRAENERLRNTIAWQASRLRGETVRVDDERPAGGGTIYALLSGYNVKIGWTGRDLQERLREYPPSTQLLVHFPGKRGDETRIKRRFAHLRTHGNEWFPYAPLVTEWVEQMIQDHGGPDPTITCGPAKYTTPRPHADKQTVKPRHTAWHVA